MASYDQPDTQLSFDGLSPSDAELLHDHLEDVPITFIGRVWMQNSRKLALCIVATSACVVGALCWQNIAVGNTEKFPANTRHGAQDAVELAEEFMRARLSSEVLRWSTFPTKCISVVQGNDGAALHMLECDHTSSDMKFLVPMDGVPGPIQWVPYPEVCVSWPGEKELLLERCSSDKKRNLEWIFDVGGKGRIQWAAHPDQCLDVTDGAHDGQKVRVWPCKDKDRAASMSFTTKDDTGKPIVAEVPKPVVNCVWGPWLDWSECSLSCDSGARERSRTVAQSASHNGEACVGDDAESGQCNTAACPTTTTTPASLVEEIRAQRQKYQKKAPAEESFNNKHEEKKSGSARQHKGFYGLMLALAILMVFNHFA